MGCLDVFHLAGFVSGRASGLLLCLALLVGRLAVGLGALGSVVDLCSSLLMLSLAKCRSMGVGMAPPGFPCCSHHLPPSPQWPLCPASFTGDMCIDRSQSVAKFWGGSLVLLCLLWAPWLCAASQAPGCVGS